MLPFLKRKNEAGIATQIIQKRSPDESQENQEDSEYSLEDCAQDIMDAIQSGDASKLASALKEAFQKMESEPHEEGEHISPHTYEAQKED